LAPFYGHFRYTVGPYVTSVWHY